VVPTLRLHFLGTLEIQYEGQQLPKPPTLKSQSLLAYLILHRDRPQPRDRLMDLFWGDRAENKARRSLRTALWHIRRCLPEGFIPSDPHTVQFDPQRDVWLDVDEFESLASHDDLASLQSALALYRGDFLDGFYDDWIINERYRLESLSTEARARLMMAQEARGEHQVALVTALGLLDHDPFREDAHRLAMRAYCRLGQRNAALEQYHRCREMVGEELGTEPMVETTELYQQILDGRFVLGRVAEAVRVEMPWPRASPASGRNPLDVAARAILVGREEELGFLQDCWQRGQGGLVLVSGEAGVGKTRLVEEFADHLRWQGVRVLWGSCYEFERVLPYQPVAGALRSALPTLTPAALAEFPDWAISEVARLVPEILERRRGLEIAVTTRPQEEQARLFDAAARFLAELTSRGALLVALEDLHWASESALRLLHYLARHLAGHPIFMVGTFRPEEITPQHPLLDFQRRLTREQLADSLHLPCLSRVAVEAMMVEMSGAGEAVMPLAERLYRDTEGNPFFLIETVKALFDMGRIRLEEGAWRGDFARISQEALPLPGSVSGLIEARAGRLSENAQELLRVSAVIGREFDFDLLNAIWDQGEEPALEALDELLRHRLIEEGLGTLGRDYAFTHQKIQEALYNGMPRWRRQQTHAQVGVAMERLYGPQAEDVAGELTFHFLEGMRYDKELTEKAIDYLLRAGDHARLAYAHHEAIDYYQRALGLLKQQHMHDRAARTLMKLGLTHHTAFNFRGARDSYDEGFALWQRSYERQAVSPLPTQHALRLSSRDPLTLDPTTAFDVSSLTVIRHLFSGLVDLGPEMDVLPEVARSWEVSEGGRKYVFHLRDDAGWTDGTPVTAGDFEYAWKRMLDLETGWYFASLLYDVKGARAFHQGEVSDPDSVGVSALDDVTLAVELEAPAGYFLNLLAYAIPVPRHVVEAHGDGWAEAGNFVTNGPFQLEAWERGQAMLLTRNPDYNGRVRGNVQQVELSLLPSTEWAVALARYERDGLDVLDITSFPVLELDHVRQRHAGEYISASEASTYCLGFDATQPPFDDPRVRRAFSLAIDKERLADAKLGGYSFPATGGFVPPTIPGHSAGIGLPYDPDQARRLLSEGGYPGGRGFPLVEAAVVSSPETSLLSEYLQDQWRKELAVDSSWELLEWQPLLDKVYEEPPHIVGVRFLSDYPDPDDFLRVAMTHSRSFIGWPNEPYDELVEAARRVTDQGERMKLYSQADRILVEDAALIPLTYGRRHLLVKPWVRNYLPSGINSWACKDVVIDSH
jgi:ABC-type oligopeptide transport system substrate-binding subunit/DNA-binding SARP family transcriptional activator